MIFTDYDVAFSVRYGAYNKSKDDRMVFFIVELNHGLGYNSSTDLFTAPYPGLYTFTAQICNNGYTVLNIRKNANNIAILTILDFNTLVCATTTRLTELDKGDEIDVFGRNRNIPIDFNNHFTGYLLRNTLE